MKSEYFPSGEPVPVIVFSGTEWDAGLVKTMLEDEGIQVFLKDEIRGTYAPWQVTAGGAGSVKVVVSSDDVKTAREIVERFYRNMKGEK